MTERVHQNPNLIYSEGTQVVSLRDVIGAGARTLHPRGSVGVVIRSPGDLDYSYRVRFPDGVEEALHRDEIVMLALYKEGEIGNELQMAYEESHLQENATAAAALNDLVVRIRLKGRT